MARLKSIGLHGIKHIARPAWHQLTAAQARYHRDFYALRDISLEVGEGEAVGIIGRNGSGKSTLLQIIAGTLTPTSGTVEVNGRAAALLELGSGFNPEFTGRENVYMNGLVLGLRESEIDGRFDAIAAYADIGDFLEQPVKTYSNGMVVRLAFAVAAHVDARILIIDEALSVGDARFQLKCARTIDRYIEDGRTLLFVSHDLNSVNRLCTAAVLLEQGQIKALHTPRIVTNLYTKMMEDDRGLGAINEELNILRDLPFDRTRRKDDQTRVASRTMADESGFERTSQVAREEHAMESEWANADGRSFSGHEFTVGGDTARIETIDILNAYAQPTGAFTSGDILIVRAQIRSFRDIPHPIFSVRIRDTKAMDIYGTNTLFKGISTPNISVGDIVEVIFKLTLNVLQGPYFVSVGCAHFEGDKLIVHHKRFDAVEIYVTQSDHHTFGIVDCHGEIHVRVVTPSVSVSNAEP